MAAMRESMKIKWKNIDDDDDQFEVENDEKDEEFLQKLELPHHLITHAIIIRLPIKYLIQFKSVSKQWYSTLSSPHFGISHFNYHKPYYNSIITHLFVKSGNDYFIYSYNDQEIDVDFGKGLYKLEIDFDGMPKDDIFFIGSSNGLLCFYSSLAYLILWNPLINQWLKFSSSFLEPCKNTTWGFGYVSSVDDYKVVRMSESKLRPGGILAHVFSLRTQEWKQVYDERLDQYLLRGASLLPGLLVNETLYWIMYKRGGDYDLEISGFDLGMERLNTIHSVVPGNSYVGWVRFLCSMGGCLSMGRFTNRGDFSVSMFKQSGQIDYIGVYRDLDLGCCCGAVGFTRDGKFFIQLGGQELGIVNPNCSPKTYSTLFKFKGGSAIEIKSYVPSLVSPLAVARMQE